VEFMFARIALLYVFHDACKISMFNHNGVLLIEYDRMAKCK
jgi:hypothetical protein